MCSYSLDLTDTDVCDIPDNGCVYGNLIVTDKCELTIGINVMIYGDLELYNPRLTKLPDGLTVYGSLSLSKSPNIKKLGVNTTIQHDLVFVKSRIEKVPENLIVHGKVHLGLAPFSTTSPTSKFFGEVQIQGCPDFVFPNRYKIYGDLICTETTYVPPADLIVCGKIVK